MSGYFSTTGTWSLTDEGHYHSAQYNYQGDKVTAKLTITAGTGSSCDYKIEMSHNGDYNYFQLYLSIEGTEKINKYYNGSSSTNYATKTGTATISGDTVSFKLGVSTSKDSTSTTYMTFKEGSLTRSKWTDGSGGNVNITEYHIKDSAYVNKVVFSGNAGTKGDSNSLSSSTLYYTDNGTLPTTTNYTGYFNLGSTSNGSFTKEISFSKNCTIKARVYNSFTYNNAYSSTAECSVKYCTIPSFSKAPVLTYNKSRLTIKEPWTFSWTGVDGTNCPIVSYRLRLFKGKASNAMTQIAIKNASGEVISDSEKRYDTGNTNTSFVLDPIENGFEPGDIVKLSIFAQGKTANTENLWWSGNGTTHTYSAEYLVQNAGVMRPLVNSKHVEGVVLVALQDNSDKGYTWTEADVVKVYTPNKKWAEAE